uniref:(northern house mosquito) hypothetical protein n=2 Tax=Culex pipiens TaxID=7175 RepID=A0A8D8EXP9_CULPI
MPFPTKKKNTLQCQVASPVMIHNNNRVKILISHHSSIIPLIATLTSTYSNHHSSSLRNTFHAAIKEKKSHTFPRNLPNDPATRSITPVLNPLPSPFPCILVGRSLFFRGVRLKSLPPTPSVYQWTPDNGSLLLLLSKLNRNSHVETRLCSAPVVMICTNRCSTRVRCNCSKLRDRLNSQLLTAALRNLRLNPRLTESPRSAFEVTIDCVRL